MNDGYIFRSTSTLFKTLSDKRKNNLGALVAIRKLNVKARHFKPFIVVVSTLSALGYVLISHTIYYVCTI